jgi:hypothetical protein
MLQYSFDCPAQQPKSTTLFRNPASGADITAFTISHPVKDIICPTHYNIVFLHIKQEFLHLSVVDSGQTFPLQFAAVRINNTAFSPEIPLWSEASCSALRLLRPAFRETPA